MFSFMLNINSIFQLLIVVAETYVSREKQEEKS